MVQAVWQTARTLGPKIDCRPSEKTSTSSSRQYGRQQEHWAQSLMAGLPKRLAPLGTGSMADSKNIGPKFARTCPSTSSYGASWTTVCIFGAGCFFSSGSNTRPIGSTIVVPAACSATNVVTILAAAILFVRLASILFPGLTRLSGGRLGLAVLRAGWRTVQRTVFVSCVL